MTDLENLKIIFCKAVKNATTINDLAKIVIQELPEGITKAIPEFMLAYCIENGLAKRGDPTLAFIEQEAKETREQEAKENRKKTAAELAEKIALYQKNLENELPIENADLISLAGDIGKQAATLGENPAIVDRVGSWESYITECITYEPEKDFRPELFDGLAFPPGTVSYIGARAKVGKTTAMINLCREALFNNRKVFFITLEMSRKQLLTKLVLCTAYSMAAAENKNDILEKIDTPSKNYYNLIKNKRLAEDEFKTYIHNAIEFIRPKYKTGLWIYDGRGADFQTITAAILKHATPETIVLLDYVQRMPSVDKEGSDNYMRVKKISDGVLNAATQTESIIISGAQFNRDTKNKKAMDGAEVVELTDFRESGDIEQDGHNLIGIGRLAGQGTRYIKMLAARESLVEDNAYSLHFQGAYSYMARHEKIPAPEPALTGGQGTGLRIGRLKDIEKETAISAIKAYRDNKNNTEEETTDKPTRKVWNPGGKN